MNLNFLVGTAAELIKVYPLIHESLKRGHGTRIVMTGQSRENLLMQYRDFALPEEILVPLLESHGDLKKTSSALRWFVRAALIRPSSFRSKLLLGDGLNYAVVHGDTLSTLVGAWLSWRAGIKTIHIEAGLRSPSLFNPFPEEINRRLVSHMVDFHMAPDTQAKENLELAEVSGEILNTNGNTLLDAVLLSARVKSPGTEKPFVLANLHRFENLNSRERWSTTVDTVVRAAQTNHVIFVAHPQTLHKLAADPASKERLVGAGVEIRERMPFSAFISLLKRAVYLISDGGSNQEECSYLGKPCLLLRQSTERQEGLEGCCLLSQFESEKINLFLADPSRFARAEISVQHSPTQKIFDFLERH